MAIDRGQGISISTELADSYDVQGLIEEATAAKEGAELALSNIGDAETNAAVSAASAATSATSASASDTSATIAKNAAELAETNAETAETNAETAQTAAELAETHAETAETNAQSSENDAETAQTAAETAKTQAETSKTAAISAKTSAEAAETSALSSKNAASASQSSATASATSATASAASAGSSATDAQSSEDDADTSAIASAASASASSSSASSASTSASTATTQAGIATTKASESSTSATNSANSATSSAASATVATTKAATATTQAGIATTQAGIATTKAGIATTKAGEASTSATSAAGSATTATTKATSATVSATTATTQASGSKATAPTVDNDGNALVVGALFFDSAGGVMKVYTASGWIATSSATLATMERFTFNATAGQTAFSGLDEGGVDTLAIIVGAEIVTMNGIVLEEGSSNDYTVTTSTLTLTSAAAVNDEVNIYAFGNFEVANHYTKTASDARYAQTVNHYTKTEGDARFEPIDSAYTKAESDTLLNTKLPTAGGTLTGNLNLGDNVKAQFGASNDLQIYHDGNSWIKDEGTGYLGITTNGTAIYLQKGTSETLAEFGVDGACKFRYDNLPKLATTSTGIDVTGSVTCDGLTVKPSSGSLTTRIEGATNNDSSKLYVSNISSGDGGIKYNAASNEMDIFSYSTLRFNVGTANISGAIGNERLRITSAGNVGIGTSTPTSELTIKAATPQIDFTNSTSNDVLANIRAEIDAGTGGKLVIQTKRDGNTALDRVTINDDGKVGIGTSSPGAKLHSTGNVLVGAGNSKEPLIQSTNSGRVASNPGYSFNGDLDTGMFNPNTNNTIAFATGATERMRITSSGNVGIGTSSPSGKLHIGGVGEQIKFDTLNSTGSAEIQVVNDYEIAMRTWRGAAFGVYAGNSNFRIQEGSVTRLMVNGGGNVGIGTSSPSAKLHVEGSGLIDAYNTGAEEGIFFREGFSSSNKYNMGIMTYAHNGSSHDGITIGAYNGFSICTGSNARQERFKVHGSGNITISAYNGTAASPSESADWPTPALAIRTYDSHSRNSVMSFGYPGDGIYQTGDTVWNLRLSNITGGNAATSSSNTNLELLGPGKLIVGKLHVGATDETTKQQIGSMPHLIAINGGSLRDGQQYPFTYAWSGAYSTSNVTEETVTTGTVWSSRSASSQELLTLMGRANVQHFVRSFEIRRVTAAKAAGGYTFPYQQVPYGRSWTNTHAAFVKWVSGPLPYGWWCNGLVADGNWHWCAQHTSGTNHHYSHTHPYLHANDGTPSVILVALPGSVDKRVDEPTEWQTFSETEF